MKANAPEKIYLERILCSNEVYDNWKHQKTISDDIEYIRTDAFIEKACDWLEDNIDRYLYNTGGYGEYIPKCGGKMYEDFKKAMEE